MLNNSTTVMVTFEVERKLGNAHTPAYPKPCTHTCTHTRTRLLLLDKIFWKFTGENGWRSSQRSNFFFLSRLTRICPPYHSQSKMAVGSSALALCSFVDVGHSGAGSKEGKGKARTQLRDTQVTISTHHHYFLGHLFIQRLISTSDQGMPPIISIHSFAHMHI